MIICLLDAIILMSRFWGFIFSNEFKRKKRKTFCSWLFHAVIVPVYKSLCPCHPRNNRAWGKGTDGERRQKKNCQRLNAIQAFLLPISPRFTISMLTCLQLGLTLSLLLFSRYFPPENGNVRCLSERRKKKKSRVRERRRSRAEREGEFSPSVELR